MGWGTQVPLPDERMQKTIDKVGLGDSELKTLYKKFCKCDKDKSGTIDIQEFYHSIKETESTFGNAIFNLIDCDHSGQLDFSEYVSALSTYCLFGRDDILKFCFFVFDEDKNGTIEGEELNSLLEMLHSDGQNSNMKLAMAKFDFNSDGKIDFDEFKLLNAQFPTLLYPAFRMQQNMRKYTLGEKWWAKQLELFDQEKQDAVSQGEKAKEKKLKQKKKLQKKAARAKMGCFQYYFCPCRRSRYIVQDEEIEEEVVEQDLMTDEQRKAHAEAMRRVDEMRRNKLRKAKKKDKNIVDLGERKPLTKDERKHRAMKRRQRDMNDRPGRK